MLEPLRWIELATKNKKIREHIITKPPVFILGYYRSGTTYMQQLFMQDDRLGHTSAFQMIFPEIMLCGEKWLTPLFESVARLFKQQNPIHRIPFTWHSPGEEDVGLTAFLSPLAAQWGYFFPQRMMEYFEKYVLFDNISAAGFEEWKQGYILLLKKISLANKSKQLLLKNPPNTARIKILLSLFPGAKFIFIHRNPYEVYSSKRRMWKMVQDAYALGSNKSVDDAGIILNTYSKMMNCYLQHKNLIPPDNLVEIAYKDLYQAPVETMQHIYQSLQLGDFSYCEKKMTAFADSQKKYVTLNHQLAADEVKLVSGKWEPFIRHWNYPLL